MKRKAVEVNLGYHSSGEYIEMFQGGDNISIPIEQTIDFIDMILDAYNETGSGKILAFEITLKKAVKD